MRAGAAVLPTQNRLLVDFVYLEAVEDLVLRGFAGGTVFLDRSLDLFEHRRDILSLLHFAQQSEREFSHFSSLILEVPI
jgi:hypothetical protein